MTYRSWMLWIWLLRVRHLYWWWQQFANDEATKSGTGNESKIAAEEQIARVLVGIGWFQLRGVYPMHSMVQTRPTIYGSLFSLKFTRDRSHVMTFGFGARRAQMKKFFWLKAFAFGSWTRRAWNADGWRVPSDPCWHSCNVEGLRVI